MLFNLETDPNEYNDILNNAGSSSDIFKDEENEITQLIAKMIKLLNNEKNHVPDIKTQLFEIMVTPDSGIDIDIHIIDGVHKPFQDEDEDEFPNGYNY